MTPLESLLEYVTRMTGVELSRGGLRSALEGYVESRKRELGLESLADYQHWLERGRSDELARLTEIISVPHTWFFRDPEQLEAIGEILVERRSSSRALNIWVPACATGEDAYSLSLLSKRLGVEVSIVGSDISQRSLSLAQSATYGAFSLRELPDLYRDQFSAVERNSTLRGACRASVRFVEHNLLSPPLTAPGGWDLVLCRNVLIYFGTDTSRSCVARMVTSLAEDGVIALGAGELIGQTLPGLHPFLRRGRAFFSPTSRSGSRLGSRAAQARREPRRLHPSLPVGLQAATAPSRCISPQVNLDEAAELLMGGGDPATIASRMLRLANDSPLEAALRMMAGIALYAAGEHERSLLELRAALLIDDQLWPAAVYQGLCLETLGNPQLAHTEYRHAVEVISRGGENRPALPASLSSWSKDLASLAQSKARLFLGERPGAR